MLEFDAYQRNETVCRIIQSLSLPSGSLILDVGGYPGRLRALMPEYRWIICDPLVDTPGEQVVGDAAKLPFQDNGFPVSVSLDVLEHIHPDRRAEFIREIGRVSQQAFILTFPHNEPLTMRAETFIRQAYGKKYDSKKHPWLEEHCQYGLPDTDEIMDQCKQIGWDVGHAGVASTQRWVQLQLFGLLIEDKPAGIEIAKEVDAYYKDSVYPHDFVEPSYRSVLIASKTNTPLDWNNQIPLSNGNTQQVDMELQSFLAEQTQKLLQTTVSSSAPTTSFSSQETAEYIARMETGIRLWEETCAQLNQRLLEEMQWRDKVEQNWMFRTLRVLKRLMKR